jgi:hypothetical protein
MLTLPPKQCKKWSEGAHRDQKDINKIVSAENSF